MAPRLRAPASSRAFRALQAFTLVAVCIAFSIIAHSSTDVPIARAFDVDELVGIPDKDQPGTVPREGGSP
ncbi:hypothetical protein OG241_19835 [Streptomyces sp. NBC_01390]|uniref:hypothetical protein n=1 Tax=Streptomyces sp. NBC_01390 TaxID=2903850 RepID=UPI003255137C